MTVEHSPKWLALIVTKEDGSEVCPVCIMGTDPLTGPIDISKVRVEGNSYLQGVVQAQGRITDCRIVELSQKELVARGLRKNPIL